MKLIKDKEERDKDPRYRKRGVIFAADIDKDMNKLNTADYVHVDDEGKLKEESLESERLKLLERQEATAQALHEQHLIVEGANVNVNGNDEGSSSDSVYSVDSDKLRLSDEEEEDSAQLARIQREKRRAERRRDMERELRQENMKGGGRKGGGRMRAG